MRRFWIAMSVIASSAVAAASPSTRLTASEQAELSQRLARFYSGGDMDFRLPKFSALDGRPVAPNAALRTAPAEVTDRLARLGGAKADVAYRRHWCERFVQRKFPGASCDAASRSAIEAGDNFEDLVDGWLPEKDIAYDPSALAPSGLSKIVAWSGDYWRTQWGGVSYRYAAGVAFPNYAAAVAAYQQPKAWLDLSAGTTGDALVKAIGGLSPAEKYDLAVGDTRFSLTLQQKKEGSYVLGPNGDVPDWYGICDGWAAASILTPASNRIFTSVGPAQVPITWYPHDVRALASLAWARGNYDSNFIGRRCNIVKPQRYPNGRLAEQECYDNNPATFHYTLANLLGKAGQPFVMDANFDSEVWNQPVIGYQFTYFNPLDPKQTDADWSKVAVAYDAAFKAKDRFQAPLTRGARKDGKWDDSAVEKIVGVMATVVYLTENVPAQVADPRDEFTRVTYTYDLELARDQGAWYASGGEWQNNAHPDFLWIPRQGTAAYAYDDKGAPAFAIDAIAPAGLAQSATSAARYGYPLCTVVKALAGAASGGGVYPCR